MMKIKNVKVYGLEESIIRSVYPMKVSEPSDFETKFKLVYASTLSQIDIEKIKYEDINSEEKIKTCEITEDDLKRVKKLANTQIGSGHNNFLKGIIVQFDLQYPEYFSPQLQRYHWVDIVSSQSKMHKLCSTKLLIGSCDNFVLESHTQNINELIEAYNNDVWPYVNSDVWPNINSKSECFQYIISNLPSGYLKWMGISTNYLQLKTIYKQRKNHKLSEWQNFCKWIETLPMSELITE